MVTQPQVEFRKHSGSSKLIIQIVDPRKRIFVLDGGLVDGSVILDRTVCSVTLLYKERRCTPRRGTWANEPFVKCFVNLLLQFKEVVRWHLIRTLGNRNGAGLHVDNEFNLSDRGYSRQFFWENVGKISNDGNILDSVQRGDIESIHHKDLRFNVTGDPGGVVNNLTGGVKELDRLGATIQGCIVNFQPIHSQDKVYGGRFQEDGGNKELNSFDFNDGVWHKHGGAALAYRGANHHRWFHRFILEVMRKCKCFRHE